MDIDATPQMRAKLGLHQLDQVKLSLHSANMLEEASANCFGSPIWQARKKAELRDLLALHELSPRVRVVQVDLREALHVMLHLLVPVACRKDEDSPLYLEQAALLGLSYREEAMRTALPGFSFVQVLMPRFCWHANISRDETQALCLGASLPAGIRCKNIIAMTYGAFSMSNYQIDILDSAGVMNARAALWWQQNVARIPLTHAPLLSHASKVELS